jgi:hypothetical protein
MGVDVLDGEEFVERIGFDRRDGIDRGVVDKKIKPPAAATSLSLSRLRAGKSLRSPATKTARPDPNRSFRDLAFASPSDAGRSCRKTRHPLRARLSQIAEPMPPAPPVTSALLPPNDFIVRTSPYAGNRRLA